MLVYRQFFIYCLRNCYLENNIYIVSGVVGAVQQGAQIQNFPTGVYR